MSKEKEDVPLLAAGELGKLLGVEPRTLKHWVTKGHLTDPIRTVGGHKRFDPKQVAADLGRNGATVPPRLLSFLEAHSPEAATLRAIARASTEDLRAELERREMGRGVIIVDIPAVHVANYKPGADTSELSRAITEMLQSGFEGAELARREERGAA